VALGGIYYSENAGRFYQPGRQGAVSNDTGIRSLIHDDETGQFIDSRGRTIDPSILTRQTFRSRDLLAYDAEGRPFVSATIRSQPISELQAKSGPVSANQDIMTRTVVTLPDGSTYISYTPGKTGQNIDPEIAAANAAKKVRAELGQEGNASGKIWNIPTNEIRARTRATEFIRRTTTAR